MGRSGRSESKKNLILHTALKLFSRNGYRAATTKEIAEAAGVAEGLIFYYFGSKEELMRSVVRNFSFVEQARERAAEWREAEGAEGLIRFAQSYLAFLDRNMDYLMFIWSPEMVQNQEVGSEVQKLIHGMTEEGGMLVTRAVRAEKPLDPVTLQSAVTMLLSSILIYAVVQGRSEQRTPNADRAYIQETVELVLGGVYAKLNRAK